MQCDLPGSCLECRRCLCMCLSVYLSVSACRVCCVPYDTVLLMLLWLLLLLLCVAGRFVSIGRFMMPFTRFYVVASVTYVPYRAAVDFCWVSVVGYILFCCLLGLFCFCFCFEMAFFLYHTILISFSYPPISSLLGFDFVSNHIIIL